MGASPTQGHAHFSSEYGFMVGLGKPNLKSLASDIVYIIEVEPQDFGALP